MRRFLNYVGFLGIAFGVAKPISELTGCHTTYRIGQTFAISVENKPFVTNINKDYGDPNHGFFIGCKETAGTINWTKWEHPMSERVGGPNRRRISIIYFFRLFRSAVTDAQRAHAETLAQYYFCENGPLAQAAQCGPKIESIIFRVATGGPSSANLSSERTVSCRL